MDKLYDFTELKAEVEKLRAAQMSAQGIEPERVRLFEQEITSLRNKLCQQEREMVEANKSVLRQFVVRLYLFFRVRQQANKKTQFRVFLQSHLSY